MKTIRSFLLFNFLRTLKQKQKTQSMLLSTLEQKTKEDSSKKASGKMNSFNLQEFLIKTQNDTIADLIIKFNYYLLPCAKEGLKGFIFATNNKDNPWKTPAEFLRDFHDYVLNFNSIFAGYEDRSDKFSPFLEDKENNFEELFYKNIKDKPNIVFFFTRDKKGNVLSFSVVWTKKENFKNFINSKSFKFENEINILK